MIRHGSAGSMAARRRSSSSPRELARPRANRSSTVDTPGTGSTVTALTATAPTRRPSRAARRPRRRPAWRRCRRGSSHTRVPSWRGRSARPLRPRRSRPAPTQVHSGRVSHRTATRSPGRDARARSGRAPPRARSPASSAKDWSRQLAVAPPPQRRRLAVPRGRRRTPGRRWSARGHRSTAHTSTGTALSTALPDSGSTASSSVTRLTLTPGLRGGDGQPYAGQVVAEAVRQAHHSGRDGVADLHGRLHRAGPGAHLGPAAVDQAEPGRVRRVHQQGAQRSRPSPAPARCPSRSCWSAGAAGRSAPAGLVRRPAGRRSAGGPRRRSARGTARRGRTGCAGSPGSAPPAGRGRRRAGAPAACPASARTARPRSLLVDQLLGLLPTVHDGLAGRRGRTGSRSAAAGCRPRPARPRPAADRRREVGHVAHREVVEGHVVVRLLGRRRRRQDDVARAGWSR